MKNDLPLLIMSAIGSAISIWLAVRILREYLKKRNQIKTGQIENQKVLKFKGIVLLIISIFFFVVAGWAFFQFLAFGLLFPGKNFLDSPFLTFLFRMVMTAFGLLAIGAGVWMFLSQVRPRSPETEVLLPRELDSSKTSKRQLADATLPLVLRIILIVVAIAVFLAGLALAFFFLIMKGLPIF